MSNIPPQSINDIVNVLNPQQQHIFNAFMNNNNNVNRNMQMGMNSAVVANGMPNNMNNIANNQLYNTFRALQLQNNNNMMNGQTTLNNTNGQNMNMNMNVQNNNTNIPMQNNMNNSDTNNYILQFLQQQLTTPNNNQLRNNTGKQVMPTNTNTIVQQNTGMISGEQQMMGGFNNGMDNNMMNMNNMSNMNIANMANMGMANVTAMNNNMNNMNNMNTNNIGNPSTPMSQMAGTVPNTITMSQQQRSGTPLSNNSGGVLSSNTNTTTNTQSGISASGMRRFSVEQIKLVQQLIEQCLKLYLSKEETMDFLCKKYENIERAFINLMWCKLEQQNPEFFKAYNTRLLIKEQISQFNQLVKEQATLMQQQGLLVQTNGSNQMPSTPTSTSGMMGVQQPMGGMANVGIMPGNIQSPYNSASSPVTNQNTFGMITNQPNVNPIQVNNGGMTTNNGAPFVYPNGSGTPGNFGINLQNAAVLGINNFQQGNNGMINPQNMNNTNAVLGFAQQSNMYRQPTNPQPNFNNNNTLSPQKQQQMNVNLGLGNETGNEPNANMFNSTVNGAAGADISQMITHLLSSPASVSNTTPQAKQTIQNFLKSPLVKVGRDVEEKLRSLLNDNDPSATSNNTNVNTTDMNRQISNSTPVTTNSGTGTSTPTILENNANQGMSNNTQNPSETPTIDNVFEFPDSEKVDVFGVSDFDDDFFHHDE